MEIGALALPPTIGVNRTQIEQLAEGASVPEQLFHCPKALAPVIFVIVTGVSCVFVTWITWVADVVFTD
jgi:hypothetical protein